MTAEVVRFVRTYRKDGIEYVCGVFCDVRGPGIKDGPIEVADITCPSCLAVMELVRS